MPFMALTGLDGGGGGGGGRGAGAGAGGGGGGSSWRVTAAQLGQQ